MGLWHNKMGQNRKQVCERFSEVTDISKKITDRRLKWVEHLERKEDDHATKRVMKMNLPGRRPGRPKMRWKDCVKRQE